jgi:A/G-specific adenine glycosylase
MKPSEKQKRDLHDKIFTWWQTNKRDLPWRKTQNPYEILVSELMLQQTQVSRVMPKYHAFLQKFPTTKTLSEASLGQILIEWKGLGYNRRAKYLHETAKEIEKTWNGVFPNKEEELRRLPGIGIYTARALLVFAFKKDVGVVDTNIRKIIQKEFNAQNCSEKEIQQIADDIVPKGKSWEWHQALMDYGAANYTEKKTKKNCSSLNRRESKLLHELSVCIWSILTLLNRLNNFIDMIKSFLKTEQDMFLFECTLEIKLCTATYHFLTMTNERFKCTFKC